MPAKDGLIILERGFVTEQKWQFVCLLSQKPTHEADPGIKAKRFYSGTA